jgi:N-acyl-D-amino-acid deacylase
MCRLVAFAAVMSAVSIAGCTGAPSSVTTTLITNVQVIDGTGAPLRAASVRIEADRIAEVGDLVATPGEAVVDGHGLVLAPGFIDTHSHLDGGLEEDPAALGAVSQGITTAIIGQDGDSPYPLREYFERREESSVAVNIASFAGHGSIRREVMGDDFRRAAAPEEVERMRELLREELAAGALGLSTGLEYDPGIYSETEEVVTLAREAAHVGGRYASHIRSEDRHLFDAIEEIIRIGDEAGIPVQVTHMKLAMRSLWGQADRLLARLEEARAGGVDVMACVYPYEYWQSTLTVLFPERDFGDREAAAFALGELAPPEGLRLNRFDPDTSYVGKTIAEIAELRGVDPVTAYMDLIAESQALEAETGESAESVMGTSMHPDDVALLIAWPHSDICTDGELDGRHPRGFGTFPRVLRLYVRQTGVLTLEEAVHKMSGLAARNMGLADRGVIRPGAFADLVLFDPATIADRATVEEPRLPSIGVDRVWVNGIEVYSAGVPTGAYPGRVLRRVEANENTT